MKKIARISAPAKAILCGEHAVVYGQDALAFGVDLKCYSNIYIDTNSNSNILSISIKINISGSIKQIAFTEQILKITQSIPKIKTKIEFENYSLNQVQFQFEQFSKIIQENLNMDDKIQLTTLYKIVLFCEIFQINQTNIHQFFSQSPLIIETSSQIPIGKGLGSSASFNSVLAASLLIISGIMKKNQIQQNFAYKNLVNYLSKFFEKVQHGRPSGIDNFVSIYGGMVLFNKTKNPPFQLITNEKILTYLSKNLCIGFVDSGVEKNTKLAVSNVLQKYNQYQQGQFKYKNMIQEIGTFPNKIIQLICRQNEEQQNLRKKFFEILSINHMYLRDLGLSNKQIQEIVDKYTIEGKSVAKITGAGMGGVVLIVGKKQFIQQVQKKEQKQAILSKMNTNGLQIQFF